jgi:hypothetical protein
MAKANPVVSVVRLDGGNVQATVKGGQADGSDWVRVLDLSKVAAANLAYAAFHGIKQRAVDSAAIPADTKTGKPAAPTEKAEAIAAIFDHLESGSADWTVNKVSGVKGGYLFEALCKVYGHMKAPSEIREWLDTLSDKEQAALREDDTIAPVIAEIKKAKLGDAPKADTKSLLAGLTAAPKEETPPQA